MTPARNQVGSVRTLLGGHNVQNVQAEGFLKIRRVFDGQSWKLPPLSIKVTYDINNIPTMTAKVPVGDKVAVESGAEFEEEFRTSWNQAFPSNSKFYEVKAMAYLDSGGSKCLFRGYVSGVNMLDARQTPSGKKMIVIQGTGSAGFLQMLDMKPGITGRAFSSGSNAWGQNRAGEKNWAMAEAIGGGDVTVPDMLEDLVRKTADQYLNINRSSWFSFSASYDTAGGFAHSASVAKWVIVNLLQKSGAGSWAFNVDGASDRAKIQVGIVVMEMLAQSDMNIWETLQGFAQQFNLGIICGVNKMYVAPIIRPYRGIDMYLSGRDVTRVSMDSGEGAKTRGIRISQTQLATKQVDDGTSVEEVNRILTSMYKTGATGRMESVGAQRWPWLLYSENPTEDAKNIAKQYILDKVFGNVSMTVTVPYVHEVLPGSVLKVEDVRGVEGDKFEPNDAVGFVRSVQIEMSSGDQPSVSTSIVMSHVMGEEAHDAGSLSANQHVIGDSVIHDVRADYEDWDQGAGLSTYSGSFTPVGSKREYPSSMIWDVGDHLDPWTW